MKTLYLIICFGLLITSGCGTSKQAVEEADPLVYIIGEIAKPGGHSLRAGTTVRGAIHAAGGFTQHAVTTHVILSRGDESRKIDLSVSDPVLKAGDILRALQAW